MPRHAHPTCPTHGTRLQCPACVSARPRVLSDAGRAVLRASLAKARAKRWPRKPPPPETAS